MAHQLLHLGVGVLPHQGLQLIVFIRQMDKHLPVLHPSAITTNFLLWALVLVLGVRLPREVVVLHVKVMEVESKMPERPWFFKGFYGDQLESFRAAFHRTVSQLQTFILNRNISGFLR